MEAALDLSAARSSDSVRIKTELGGDRVNAVVSSMNHATASPTSSTSSNQSPTSSTMATNSLFPMQFYRSLMPPFTGPQPLLTPSSASSFSTGSGSIFDNPALALASALASQGFLSPGTAPPPYANFFNSAMASAPASMVSPTSGGSPSAGSVVTPPASAPGANFFGKPNGTSTPEPQSFLPSASLALSTLHRRRRPKSFQRQQSQQEIAVVSPNGQQQSDGQSTPDSDSLPPSSKKAKLSNGSVPDNQKDELYWERRRKNNEAAKRSRDARRAKEEEIVVRAAYLEQENLKLKAQVAVLKNETAKLHFMLLNHVQSA